MCRCWPSARRPRATRAGGRRARRRAGRASFLPMHRLQSEVERELQRLALVRVGALDAVTQVGDEAPDGVGGAARASRSNAREVSSTRASVAAPPTAVRQSAGMSMRYPGATRPRSRTRRQRPVTVAGRLDRVDHRALDVGAALRAVASRLQLDPPDDRLVRVASPAQPRDRRDDQLAVVEPAQVASAAWLVRAAAGSGPPSIRPRPPSVQRDLAVADRCAARRVVGVVVSGSPMWRWA